MKTKTLLVLSLHFILTLSSCDNGINPNIDTSGFQSGMECGGLITSVGLYGEDRTKHNQFYWEYSNYDEAVTPCGEYKDLRLNIFVHHFTDWVAPLSDGVKYAFNKIYEIAKERTLFLREDFIKHMMSNDSTARKNPSVRFFTATINDEVSLTCDKVLFGLEPGTNLTKHMRAWSESDCQPIGTDKYTVLYNYGDKIPISVDSIFAKDGWLQEQYYLSFKDIPTERYDTLTFTFSISIRKEHWYDYFLEEFKGENPTLKIEEKCYKAECQMIFE